MFKPKPKNPYTILGRVPELNYVLVRNEETKKLELYTPSRGLTSRAINISGQELEYVRDARTACRVPDNDYNRTHCPDDIGRIYIDSAPIRAFVQELK